jgi:Glyoxalase-like domain
MSSADSTRLGGGDRLVQVVVLVDDLAADRRNTADQGFNVVDGGHHPGRGTANWIVPFGDQYLELLAVVDLDEALRSPQGRPVAAALSRRGPGLARWSLETTAIAAASRRLGLPVERRERLRPDGRMIRWQSVGVDEAWEQPWRCAFMAWDGPLLHPARMSRDHANGATGFSRLEVIVEDRDAAIAWSGGAIPSEVVLDQGSQPGPIQLTFATPGRALTIP